MTFTLIVIDRTGGSANEKAEKDSVQGGISGEYPSEDEVSAVLSAPGPLGGRAPARPRRRGWTRVSSRRGRAWSRGAVK